ncbi:3-phosphoshikimate 1-carboxyvinyltransferase [Capnocytophaga canimorsus]|uniref:3-phosphoshikimate 1-carboxyvinyltransferase n=1 Tax=Capnocytophaga canimorsus TaxID=28188 RepID=UPI0037D140ED
MQLHLPLSKLISDITITPSGSKSETNRLLLLQACYPNIQIKNGSDSDDSKAVIEALNQKSGVIDVHHAGTAMRFLTAYFASQNHGKSVILTGSTRMKERPIGTLVTALNQLGADICYLEKEGFPPLQIHGKKLQGSQVCVPANISSQFISALLLIAPSLPQGLCLQLEGKITSTPYIKMTLALLESIGVQTSFINNEIKISPIEKILPQQIIVESDWSSASYWFSFVALSKVGTRLNLKNFKTDSLQGDAILTEIYQDFGVTTTFEKDKITLYKAKPHKKSFFSYDLVNAPDIAQTIAVTCFGLEIDCQLLGLHTLKIKETDRLTALKNELCKLGAQVTTSQDSLSIKCSDSIQENIAIDTYNDHRMAMAFAPLMLKVPIVINNYQVVSKSYPEFWNDIQRATSVSLPNTEF